MSELKKWIAVKNNVVVHGGWQGPQSLIDNFEDRVVNAENTTTPSWYDETVEFIDVTDLDPLPVTGWYRDVSGNWKDGNAYLETDKYSILPDGTSAATVKFKQVGPNTPTNVEFSINGQTVSEKVTAGVATLTVTSTNPNDVIQISASGKTLQISVEN